MPMPNFAKTLLMIGGDGIFALIPAAYAAQPAPLGAWRTSNGCFLTAFFLSENGGARAVYLSGESDDYAAWTWEDGILKIISQDYPLDSFSGRLTNDHVEAEYVWHDFDRDELNPQSCIFEKFTPPRP
jgi:hypothetical protein